jgi:hypothetical protein
METRRQNLLKKLDETAASAEAIGLSSKCKTICFQIIYGLPWELQIRAACHICERYLPVFEAKWPDVTWPRVILGDVDAWHRVNGRGTEHAPEEADSADSAYLFCFDFLLSAYHHKDDPVSLTSGTCGAMGYAAYARAENVWLADDAIAARIEKEKAAYHRLKDAHHRNEDGSYRDDEEDYPPEPEYFNDLWKPQHSDHHNAAFVAVYRREFRHIAEWLRAEEVWKYPEPDDLDAMMRGLKRWESHEFYPMGPERAEGELPPDDTPE